MVANQVAASPASALVPQPLEAKMATTTTTSNNDPAVSQDLAPSASESVTTAIASSEELATPVSNSQSDADANPTTITSPHEKRNAQETDTVASADRDITKELTADADKSNAMDEADTVISTESSTAKEVAKEPSATTLPKSKEDAEQSSQDLQDETSMEPSRAAKAFSFPSASYLFIQNELLNFTWNSILLTACAIIIYLCPDCGTSCFIEGYGIEE